MPWSIFREGGGDHSAIAWAQQFLTRIGAPITPSNTQFVYQWEKSEGGGGRYNPLNTGGVYGHPELTTSGEQYGGGANDFASWDAGLTGSVINVTTRGPDNYPAIVTALRNNDANGARHALWNSGWASSHYGYGTNWSNASLPGNYNPLDYSGPDLATNVASINDALMVGGKSDDCLWGFGGSAATPGLPSWLRWMYFGKFGQLAGPQPATSGVCLFGKTQARAVLGAGILLIGGGLAVIGILALLKGVNAQTGASRIILETPVLGNAARKVVRR